MATISNTNDIILQAAPYRSKVTTVTISSTAGAFKTPKNGALMTPASITLTATPNSVFTASAVYTWHYAISTAPTTWVLIGTGASQAITNTTIGSIIGEATQIVYKCTVTEALLDTAYGFYSVSYSKEISEPIVVDITRTVSTLSCSSTGVVSSFANTDTSISVSRGGIALTYNSAGGANTFKVSIIADGTRTVGTISNSSTVYSISGITAAVIDYTTVVFSITVYDAAGVAQTPIGKQISYTKVYAGTKGDSGTSGTKSITINAFKWATSVPTVPTQVVTYSWATGPSIYPTGWTSSSSAPPGSGFTLYQLQLTITAPGADTLTSTNWSSSILNTVGYTLNGTNGTSGTKSVTINAFKWDNSVPTVPTQGVTYSWTTGPNIYPTGWTSSSSTPPGSGFTLYQLQLTVSAAGDATTTSTNWNASLLNIVGYTEKGGKGDQGDAGTKSVTIYAFKWDNGILTVPTQALTYSWTTGANTYPIGWTASSSTSPGTGYTLYQLQLTITAPGADTVTSANWSSSVLNTVGYTQKGDMGVQGNSHRTAYVVTTSGTAPDTPTTGTGDTVPTSVDGAWSFTATSTLLAGQYMYQTDGILVTGGNISWGPPYLSNLKVGSLSALSADLGVVQIATTGSLSSAGKTYGAATAGYFLGYSGGAYVLDIGTTSNYMRWNGTNLVASGITIKNSDGRTLLNTTGSSVPPWVTRVNDTMDPGALALTGGPTSDNTVNLRAIKTDGVSLISSLSSTENSIEISTPSTEVWNVMYNGSVGYVAIDGTKLLDYSTFQLEPNTVYMVELNLRCSATTTATITISAEMPAGTTGYKTDGSTFTSGTFTIATLSATTTATPMMTPTVVKLYVETSTGGFMKLYTSTTAASYILKGTRFKANRLKNLVTPSTSVAMVATVLTPATSNLIAPIGFTSGITGQPYNALLTVNQHADFSNLKGTFTTDASIYTGGDKVGLAIRITNSWPRKLGGTGSDIDNYNYIYTALDNNESKTVQSKAIFFDILSGYTPAERDRLRVRITRTASTVTTSPSDFDGVVASLAATHMDKVPAATTGSTFVVTPEFATWYDSTNSNFTVGNILGINIMYSYTVPLTMTIPYFDYSYQILFMGEPVGTPWVLRVQLTIA